MKKLNALLLGSITLLSISSHAIVARNEAPFDRAGLIQLIQNNPSVTQLDQLVPLLPGPFRLNFTLKHGVKRIGQNGHLTEDLANKSLSADPLAPRAILWDERSGFMISYNGGLETQKFPNRLDLLSFDKTTKTFSLEEINFPIQPGQPGLTTSDCKSCHGTNSRPIFAMYPDWPSFYGSINDELTDTKSIVQQKELADYKQFVASAHTNNRYAPLYDLGNYQKYMKDINGNSVPFFATFPYRQDVSTVPGDISRAFTFRASLRAGIIMHRLQVQMIANKVLTHPNYPKYNRFFAFNTMMCPITKAATTTPKLQAYQKDLQTLLAQPIKVRKNGLIDYTQALAIFGLKLQDADMRYSATHPSGYANPSMDITQPQHIMEFGYIDGYYFNSYFDGSATFDELIAAALVKNLTPMNP
ncbi:MAG: hypothetical protein K2P92_01280, partial [Bdellovibrionaceae bacterium]|nr:hypothetical protein [Pseudobdellovibrionaceae bacterium]